MVSIQLGEQDHIKIGDRGPGFAEAQCRPAADVHQGARPAPDPDEVAARSAIVGQFRAARAQYLHLHRRGAAGLGGDR